MQQATDIAIDRRLPGYYHALEGRLRIYAPQVKRAPQRALFVEMLLGSMDGVVHVRANPTTGNVLVRFEPESLEHADIIRALRKADCLGVEEARPSVPVDHELTKLIRDAVVRSVTDALVTRALSALL
ncbi:MAG TPA: hypothetical protein VFS39_00375 [Nitrospira sp.]|nr:hypothetical protein [Nitrospira sp.]